MDLYGLTRPALFAIDGETVHNMTMALLERAPRLATWPYAGRPVERPLQLCGLSLRNGVGLGAGLDKDGRCIEAFGRMGFGFLEVGTVTPRPQPGNPRPRLFRLPRQQALINRMGFNNRGVDALVERLRSAHRRCVVGVNIGKNADTPLAQAVDDYVVCLQKVYADADYVTVNLSSPNTKGLRDLQTDAYFLPLLRTLLETREVLAQRHGVKRPLLVKISPDLEPEALDRLADQVAEAGVDGLIATNTTVTRPGVAGLLAASETGGLSGAPLRSIATAVVARLRERLGHSFPLIGVGGILGGEDAAAHCAAGADAVQIYTGLIYRGPALIREAAAALV